MKNSLFKVFKRKEFFFSSTGCLNNHHLKFKFFFFFYMLLILIEIINFYQINHKNVKFTGKNISINDNNISIKRICWIFDENSMYQVYISLYSIILHNQNENFHFYFIIPPNFTLDITNFSHFLKYGSRITVKHYQQKHTRVETYLNMTCEWPAVILVKFWLCEILPEVDKILYIDTDMINTGPISPIWSIPMENKTIAGVKRIHFDFTWINSGIIFYNLKFMRKQSNELWKCINKSTCFIDDYWHTICHKKEWIYLMEYRYNVEFYPIRRRMKRNKDQKNEEKNAVFIHMKDLAKSFYTLQNTSQINGLKAVNGIKFIKNTFEKLFVIKQLVDSELKNISKK